jgi:hypothetical protein
VPTRKTVLLISSDIRVRAAVIPHANILHLKVDNLASLPAQSDDRQTRLRHEYRVLLGFILMAIGLAMTGRGPRSRVFRSQIALALMIGGTILVCFGIYLKPPLLP